MYIKLTNSNKRTADLCLLPLTSAKSFKKVVKTPEGDVEPARQAIIGRKPGWAKGTPAAEIADQIIKGDPEIDTKIIGKPIAISSTAYLDGGSPVYHFRVIEEKHGPDGQLKESKPYKATEPNIELPVQIAPKGHQSPAEFAQKMVVHKVYQVVHLDSLSYDFLFELCQSISGKLVRLGAGLKGNEPVILRREGLPAFAYLRGQVDGTRYLCTLHLTHTELKAPAADPVPVAVPA